MDDGMIQERNRGPAWVIRAIIFLCGMSGCSSLEAGSQQACWRTHCFNVELATTQRERERGLQHRESLPDDAGMLFVFDRNEPHAFWMKDTWIPLDIIWLDAQRRVSGIAAAVPPCEQDPCPTYSAPGPSSYVLEINAGLAEKLGIRPGDPFDFHIR